MGTLSPSQVFFYLQRELSASYLAFLLHLAFFHLHLFSLLTERAPAGLESALVLGTMPLLSLNHFLLLELLP